MGARNIASNPGGVTFAPDRIEGSRDHKLTREEVRAQIREAVQAAFNTPSVRRVVEGPTFSEQAQRVLNSTTADSRFWRGDDVGTMGGLTLSPGRRNPAIAEGSIPVNMARNFGTAREYHSRFRRHDASVHFSRPTNSSERTPQTAITGRRERPQPRMTNVYLIKNGERQALSVPKFRNSAELLQAINSKEVNPGDIVALTNSRGEELPYLVYRNNTDHSIHWHQTR